MALLNIILSWFTRILERLDRDFRRFNAYGLFWGIEAVFLLVVIQFTAVASGVNLTPRWRQSENAFWWLTGTMLFFEISGVLIALFAPSTVPSHPAISRRDKLWVVAFHTTFNLLGYSLFFFFGGKAV